MIVDLTMDIFDYAKHIAEGRHNSKKYYLSSNQFSDNYEMVGVLGEIVYGYMTHELMDLSFLVGGDDGTDFRKRVQVKTSEKFKAKHLIEYPQKDFNEFDYYVFVVVDLSEKTGEIAGWISVPDFLHQAEEIDFGYGIRLALHLDKLNKWHK